MYINILILCNILAFSLLVKMSYSQNILSKETGELWDKKHQKF